MVSLLDVLNELLIFFFHFTVKLLLLLFEFSELFHFFSEIGLRVHTIVNLSRQLRFIRLHEVVNHEPRFLFDCTSLAFRHRFQSLLFKLEGRC